MTLAETICEAIDVYNKTHPTLSVNEIFAAMREIHKDLSAAADRLADNNKVVQIRDWQR